ncbi:MAG: UDP-3-O-acyl-N-acetylglucosamine deacetylase [Alphaproteobacteria bacterium]|nr:UDP-3-O-acyl-N-acetylglucosamine deacetylase [Alphaproteobacteria bacterium]
MDSRAAGTGRQQTLRHAISCSGTGLHSGATVHMTLAPASTDSGIVFRRVDLGENAPPIPATIDNVIDDRLCTTIGFRGGPSVVTIEHLMAALRGTGIDNVEIAIDGPEVPVMDGSAAPFVFLLECAGLVAQLASRRAIEVLRPVGVAKDGAEASLTPGLNFSAGCEIDFASRAIGRQSLTVSLVNGTFKSDIARARTFGFAHEVDRLRAAGLARGGSLDNAVVVAGDRVLNDDGLRWTDEFVRHKILDSIGDLYLAGAPIIGRFHGRRSGHALNHLLVRTLLADRGAWRWTTESSVEIAAGATPAAAAAAPATL